MSGHSDHEQIKDLIARAIEGDEAAWAQLDATYRAELERHLRIRFPGNQLTSDEMDDAIQETFIELIRLLEKYDPNRGDLGTLIRIVAVRKGIDLWRKKGRNRERGDDQALKRVADSASDDPLDVLVSGDDQRELKEALDALGEEQRSLLRMVFFEGMSIAKTAAKLGLTPTAVRARQIRAIQALRTHLRKKLDF